MLAKLPAKNVLKTIRHCNFSGRAHHEEFLSENAKKRIPSATREIIPLLQIPGMLSLATGLPNPSLFPFKSFSFTLTSGEEIQLTKNELNVALQYSQTNGIPELISWLKNYQYNEHKPPYISSESDNQWDIVVSTGSQDLITRVIDTILNDNDSLIIESPTYVGVLTYLKSKPLNLLSVPIDDQGMIPEELENAIKSAQVKPKLMYLIPTGQNPSGITYSDERKKQIYEIASKHDILILEDDPYYFLSFGPDKAPASIDLFKRKKVTSFLSIDDEQRVIRVDSFSKILSSGLRIGFCSGPSLIVKKVVLNMQTTCLHTSGLSQMVIYKLLNHWGTNEFYKQINNVSYFYNKQRDILETLSNQYLTNMCTWTKPSAGMFYWYKVLGLENTEEFIKEKAKTAKVLLLPGQPFFNSSNPSSYVRATYSMTTYEQMDLALKRFSTLIKYYAVPPVKG